MKKILLIAALLLSMQLLAQTYPVTGITITLPANPDANTANWKSGAGMLTISAAGRMVNGVIDGRVKESRILVVIKKNGAVACGNFNSGSAPASNFSTVSKVWSGSNAVSLLGQECVLPPGDYELCVQLFGEGAAPIPMSEEKCKVFSIKAKDELKYQSPQPLQPANNASFTMDDVKRPFSFKWTPTQPRPTEPVTYRLKVWQLMEGQNGTQAMKVNQPLITKDIDNLTQHNVTSILTGPCKPPYLCDFVWNVQALNREGKPIGENNGTSEAYAFTISNINGCPRKNVSFFDIDTELNRVSHCAVPVNGCANYNEITTSEIHNIWNGPPTHNFTIAEQNTLMAEARQWALDNRPPGCNNTQKSIISITYLELLAVSDLDMNYCFVGIVVQYGCCTSVTNSYSAMQINLSSPANNSTLRSGNNMTFTWSPSSTPPEGTTYRIKIAEIKGDESAEQALRTNKPFFEKDSLNYIVFNYPPDAPRLKEGNRYAWHVQASGRDGKPVGTNNGTSGANMFIVSTAVCAMTPTLLEATCIATTATTKTIRVKIKIENTSSVALPATVYMNHANTITHPLYASLALTSNNLIQPKNQSFVVSPGVISVVPAIPLAYPVTIAQGSSAIQEVDVTISNTATGFNLLIIATSKGNNAADALVPCYDDIRVTTIPPCPCTYCTDDKIVFNGANTITDANNTLTLNNNISIPGTQVKQFKAELIGFSYAPSNNNEQCWVCNKDDNQWGNFTGGTFSSPFPSMVNGIFPSIPCCGGNSHHTIGWWGAATTISNRPLQLKISLPPASTLSCCPYKITLCIRYTFTDSECRSCSVIKCFSYVRQPHPGGPIPYDDIYDADSIDDKKK